MARPYQSESEKALLGVLVAIVQKVTLRTVPIKPTKN